MPIDWPDWDKRFTGNGECRSLLEGTLDISPSALVIPQDPEPVKRPMRVAPPKLIQKQPKRKPHYTRHDTWYEWDGKRRTLRQWADQCGMSLNTLQQRWYRGERGDRLLRPAKKRTLSPDLCGTEHQYRRRGCRCGECKAAHAKVLRDYRLTRRQR